MNKLLTKIAGLTLGLTMAIGVGVATFATADEPVGVHAALADNGEYSYTFTAKQFTANTTKELGGVKWTVAGDGNFWGYDATKGHQFGSGNNPYKSMTFTSAGFSGKKITKIIINTSGASSISGSFTTTVGGTQYGSKTTLTKNATSYTFTGTATGEICFTYSQTSSKAIYIKSISATYVTASSGLVKLTAPSPAYNDLTKQVKWADVSNASSYKVSVDNEISYQTATSPFDVSNLTANTEHTVYVKAIGDGTSYRDSDAGSVTFTPTLAKEVVSITVATQPSTITYKEGQKFNPSGIKVVATFDDGSEADVTDDCTYTPDTSTSLTTDDKSVTVAYTYNEKTVNTYVAITVSESPKYKLVTSITELTAGSSCLIGNSDGTAFISTTQNSNNRSATLANAVSNVVVHNDNFEVIELGGNTGAWTFKTSSGYLYAASSSANYLRTQNNLTDDCKWDISLGDGGLASIVAQGENTRNLLKYNPNNENPIFSCYASTSTTGTGTTLWKLVDTAESVAISANTLSGLKGDSDESIIITANNFVPTGISVEYTTQNIAEVSKAGIVDGKISLKITFNAIGETTATIDVDGGKETYQVSLTISVLAKPETIEIQNETTNDYLEVRNSNSGSQYGYQQLNVVAKDTDGNDYPDNLLTYEVISGSEFIGLTDAHRVYGKAVGEGVVKVYATNLPEVYDEISVKSFDDSKTGVKKVLFNLDLTANAGDILSIESVFNTRTAQTYFNKENEQILDSELKFSYVENDYDDAVSAENFVYMCDETTAVGETEQQTVYVYCTLDKTWSKSFKITVTQTDIELTGLTITNVVNNELDLLRNTTFQLSVAFNPANATNKDVRYYIDESSEEGHSVTVSETGLISAGKVPNKSAVVVVESVINPSICDMIIVNVTREAMTLTIQTSEKFEKVTSKEQLTDGQYIIVSENSNVVLKDAENSDNNDATYSSIEEDVDTLKQYCFTYNATTKTLMGKNGQYIGKEAEANGMDTSETVQYVNEISFEENGDANIVGAGGSSLRYNTSWKGFRYYKSGQQAIQMYKLVGGDGHIEIGDDLFDCLMDYYYSEEFFACDPKGLTFDGASWNKIGELIIEYKDSYKLDLAKADSEGNEVERFLATYDYVVGKYGAEYDYLGRISSGVISVSKNNSLTFEINQSIDSGTLILVITLVTISTLGGYFFIRKRKED